MVGVKHARRALLFETHQPRALTSKDWGFSSQKTHSMFKDIGIKGLEKKIALIGADSALQQLALTTSAGMLTLGLHTQFFYFSRT